MADSFCWLVERRGSPPLWLKNSMYTLGDGWTTDATSAEKFATKAEAEDRIVELRSGTQASRIKDWEIVATEHGFMDFEESPHARPS
jgi:hypothetical protein